MESTQAEQQKEKNNIKKWGQVKGSQVNIKCPNICIIGVPEGGARKGWKTYLKK